MLNGIEAYLFVIALGALGAFSDVILNQWAKTGRTAWLLAAYAAWLCVATLLGTVLRWGYFSFGTSVILFVLTNTLLVLVIDHQYFSTRLTFWSWLGIALAIIAIVCIEIGRSQSQIHGS